MFLYNKYKVGFLHIPKTAGLSLDEYLKNVIGSPEKGFGRHNCLDNTYTLIPKDYKIISVIRNPYDRLVSNYEFWKTCYDKNNIHFAHEAAFTRTYKEWVIEWLVNTDFSQAQPTKYFMTVDGKVPDNVVVLRFENIEQEINDLIKSLGIETDEKFPHNNKTKHKDYNLYYDDELRQVVYDWEKWCFENYYK